ncbi:MAG: AAA family ATPase [Magnetococcales bacterium]|nr:AAA family ATPase [Magnetococcales bacterium]
MNDRPFLGNWSNARQFFSVRSHGFVWRTLRSCIAQGEGVIVITGEAGIGKSQLLLRLQGLLPDNWDVALIADASQPQALFTQALCEAVGAEIAGPQEWSMTADEVLDAIASRVEFGRNFLLAIDDAHRLTQENLNILNSILLFAVSQARPVQLLLMGRPELVHCLDLPAFQLLRNAMVATVEMPPLTRVEVWEYVRFRAERILGKPPRMTWPAWLELFSASRGAPREIDLLLQKILFLNKDHELRWLTGSLVRKGRVALDPNYHPPPGRGFIPWVALALLASLVGYLSGALFFAWSPPVRHAVEPTATPASLPAQSTVPAAGDKEISHAPPVPPVPPVVEEKQREKSPPPAQSDTGTNKDTQSKELPTVPGAKPVTRQPPGAEPVPAHPLPDTKPLKRTPPQPAPKPPVATSVPSAETPDTTAEVATQATLRASGRVFVVQIGSFLNKINAEQLAHTLKQKGLEPYVHLYQKEEKNWFSVRINHKDRPAAEKTSLAVHQDTGQPTEVIDLFYE